MNIYVVIKDNQPCQATFSEREAEAAFNDLLHDGGFRQAELLLISTFEADERVLLGAYQS